ncbi:hypothetical protein J2Z83_001917 [Virgibacillus natechei]|uniref:Uncharacterized protein n=1 Tax=Virgibacillus natechei TaxID=1216297 RepID=A0ABS4IFT9_9BACI|nr:hypothetical protein [Virgibacillus natechei]
MKTPVGGKASVRPHSALNDEGQLKPPFAGNVGIPLTGARRLTSRPRKAKCVYVANPCSQPAFAKKMSLRRLLHQLRRFKSNST